MKERVSWNEYFMDLARRVSVRSTCIRRQVGAIVVRDHRILSTGYNGAPSGTSHCTEKTCLRTVHGIPSGEQLDICKGLHAEQNAIIQAALHGVSIKDSVLYCTNQPCLTCAKMLINSGVKTVFYDNPYNDPMALEIFKEAETVLISIDEVK